MPDRGLKPGWIDIAARGADMSLYAIEISEDRFLAIDEIGETDGFPIIVNHGMIASIREDRLFDSLVDAGFRVMSIARPGYGLSTPFGMKSIKEWGNIVEGIIDNKRIEQFDVLGMSSGAPYSYAIAHAMPDKIRNTYIFSGTPALCDERVKRLWPYPLKAEATIEELQKTAKELFFENGINEEDMGSVDSAKNGCFGIALDLKIRCQDWGFSLGDIKTKVYMEHGIDDASVPFGTAEITAGLLPNCVMIKRANGGHFSNELLDEFIKKTIITT